MQGNSSGAPPTYTADEIYRYIAALPAIGRAPMLDERAAQAARSILGRTDSNQEQRLREQINTITREIEAHLDRDTNSGRYTVTEIELHGIIARAVSRASSQLAVDMGRTMTENESWDDQIETSSELEATGTAAIEPLVA